eukprot:TRINITY_DN17044_c0_g1_i1.p1 TRINITY_DN17044_c0_g1~~TRINITY_DN17044_c0_g1_i1.p1  ORF type:complete len:550 (-),score=111.52 TRINITY_DN17044_c0_g1_i1:278-1927(-)
MQAPCKDFRSKMQAAFFRFVRKLCNTDANRIPTGDLAQIFERQGDVVLAELVREHSTSGAMSAEDFVDVLEDHIGQTIELKGKWKAIAQFRAIDRHGLGRLTREDMYVMLHKLHPYAISSIDDDYFNDMFTELDINSHGSIQFADWLHALDCKNFKQHGGCHFLDGVPTKAIPTLSQLALERHMEDMAAFFEADTDANGKLSEHELITWLEGLPPYELGIGPAVKRCWKSAEVKNMLKAFDRDCDGELSFLEVMLLAESGELAPVDSSVYFEGWTRHAEETLTNLQAVVKNLCVIEQVVQHLQSGGKARLLRTDLGFWAKLRGSSDSSGSEQEISCPLHWRAPARHNTFSGKQSSSRPSSPPRSRQNMRAGRETPSNEIAPTLLQQSRKKQHPSEDAKEASGPASSVKDPASPAKDRAKDFQRPSSNARAGCAELQRDLPETSDVRAVPTSQCDTLTSTSPAEQTSVIRAVQTSVDYQTQNSQSLEGLQDQTTHEQRRVHRLEPIGAEHPACRSRRSKEPIQPPKPSHERFRRSKEPIQPPALSLLTGG